MSALLNGIVGLIASLWVGTRFAGLSWGDSLLCVASANVAGMIAVLTILKGERTPWLKRHVLTRSRRTWPIFTALYVLLLLIGAPPMRDGRIFAWLALPTVLSTGFTIMAFGPIQDRIIARYQARIQRQSGN